VNIYKWLTNLYNNTLETNRLQILLVLVMEPAEEVRAGLVLIGLATFVSVVVITTLVMVEFPACVFELVSGAEELPKVMLFPGLRTSTGISNLKIAERRELLLQNSIAIEVASG